MIVVDNFLDATTWEQFNHPSMWQEDNSGNYSWLPVDAYTQRDASSEAFVVSLRPSP